MVKAMNKPVVASVEFAKMARHIVTGRVSGPCILKSTLHTIFNRPGLLLALSFEDIWLARSGVVLFICLTVVPRTKCALLFVIRTPDQGALQHP